MRSKAQLPAEAIKSLAKLAAIPADEYLTTGRNGTLNKRYANLLARQRLVRSKVVNQVLGILGYQITNMGRKVLQKSVLRDL